MPGRAFNSCSQIQIGDWVQIKSLRELERISASDIQGRLKLPSGCFFVPEMYKYCGLIAEVTDVRRRFDPRYFTISLSNNPVFDRLYRADGDWTFTSDMVKKVEGV